MPNVADLQSWGQCSICKTNLWCEQSDEEQHCGCNCGAVALHNDEKIGDDWAAVSAGAFQAIVDDNVAVSS